jgi:hypothetical protein
MKRLLLGLAAACVLLCGCTAGSDDQVTRAPLAHAAKGHQRKPVSAEAARKAARAAKRAAEARHKRAIARNSKFLHAIKHLVSGPNARSIKFAHAICSDLQNFGPRQALHNASQGIDGASAQHVYEVALAAARSYCPRNARDVVAHRPKRITFRVRSNGSYSSTITYAEDTDIEQATNAAVPWKKMVPAHTGFFQVSAQDGDGTAIECEIDGPDGSVLDRQISTGLYAIASCSASY